MGILCNGMTIYLNLSTKIPNKKQKARSAIAYITNQYFRKFLKEIKKSPYLGYNKRRVHNEPTESSFFLIKTDF